MSELVFCTVVKDRTQELKRVVRKHAPFADRSIVVLHRHNPANEEFIQSQECQDWNVEWTLLDVPYHPPTMRNTYLHKLTPGSWAFHMDCDEYLEEPALYQLRTLVAKAEEQQVNRIAFNAHDIRIGLDGQVSDNKSGYFNPMMFKAYEGICWAGETHGGIHTPGVQPKIAQVPYRYFHIKTSASEFLRGCHNYWSTGQVAQNNTNVPEWKELKHLFAQHGYREFADFYPVMLEGKVPEDIKHWFIMHRDDENSEARSWFVVYFGLMHPEQNIYLAGNRDLPYDKDRKPYTGEMTY